MIFSYKTKWHKNIAFQADKEGEFYRTRCGKLFAVDVFNNVYLIGSDSEYRSIDGSRMDRARLSEDLPGKWVRRGTTTYFGTKRSGNIRTAFHMGKLHD